MSPQLRSIVLAAAGCCYVLAASDIDVLLEAAAPNATIALHYDLSNATSVNYDPATKAVLQLFDTRGAAAASLVATPWTPGGITTTAVAYGSVLPDGVTFQNANPLSAPNRALLQTASFVNVTYFRTLYLSFVLNNTMDTQGLFRQAYAGYSSGDQFLFRVGDVGGLASITCNGVSRSVPIPITKGATPISIKTPHVLVVENSKNALRVWLDGIVVGIMGVPQPAYCVSQPSTEYPAATIGGWYADNSFGAGLTIGELIIVNGVTNATVRSSLGKALLAKWQGVWANTSVMD